MNPRDPWPRVRDIALFVAGILGIAYETALAKSPDPTLLLVFAAMLGLPLALGGGKER